MPQEFWVAFSALGQWASAIATVVAVIVALNADKPKVKFKLVELVSDYPNSPGMNAPKIGIYFYNERNFTIRITQAYFLIANNRQKLKYKDIILSSDVEIGSWSSVISPYTLSNSLKQEGLNGKIELYFVLKDSSGREYKKPFYFNVEGNRILKKWYENLSLKFYI